jgi:uncharacterized protein (TIGR03083 family)
VIPHDTIAMLEETWASVSEVGHRLTEEQWKSSTDLPGWTVQDNVSHLIGTERMLQWLERAPQVESLGDWVRNDIGKFNEYEVEQRRGLSGAEVLAEFDELSALRSATFRDAAEDYFAQPAMTPVGPGDVGMFLAIRVLDNWMHEQDIRRAVGQPGHLDCAAAAHTVDRLALTIPIVVGKRAQTPEGGAVVVDITGGVERHIVAEVQGGRAAVVAAPTSAPLATVTMDTETFVVLAGGRRSYADVARGVQLGGDTALAERVVSNFNMMI